MAAVRALGSAAVGLRSTLLRNHCAERTSRCAKLICSQSSCKRSTKSRFISTTPFNKVNEDKDIKEEEIKEPPNWISNLLGYTVPEEKTKLISEDEKKEREALFEQITDMYFAKPRTYPTMEFYEKAVDMLIKYNDDHGVEVVWRMMQELNMEPDEELICKIEQCLEKARDAAWFK